MIHFRTQNGFSLVSAIFLLIVLASLGAYMVTIGSTNRATSTAALQGARAYQAARSGIDWSVFQLNPPILQVDARPACDNDIDGATVALTAPGLNGFTVTTTCNWTGYSEKGSDNVTVYTLGSTATSGGNYGDPDFVQRRITATISPP